jgi:hypothetical protein
LRGALALLFSYSVVITPCSLGLMETGMGELVNLRRFKKRAEKQQSAQQADANRAKFGRSKSERIAEQARSDRAGDLLDQHHIDDGDAS